MPQRRGVRLVFQDEDDTYKEEDWGELESSRVRPYKTDRHNLNSLLLRRVIVNKKENWVGDPDE